MTAMLSFALALALGGPPMIEVTCTGVWLGKPPLKRLDFDVVLRNQSPRPRWLFVPGTVGSSTAGGVYSVTVYEGALWQVGGSAGGTAVKLAAGGEVTLKNLGVQVWYSDLPPKITLPLVLADDITVGGRSITAFVGTDVSAAGTVAARIDRMKTRALAWKQTDQTKNGLPQEVAIDFVGKEDATRVVWLVGQHVTMTGKAEEAKEGPVLITDDGEHLWIDTVKGWPRGKRVKVSGQVRVKHDRPVFVPQPGQPIAAGVPVPAGTDLRAASQRLLIGDAQWTTVD